MRSLFKYGLIIGAIVVVIFVSFLLLLIWYPPETGIELFDSSSFIRWIISVGATFIIIIVILSLIISAIFWGFLLGDFRDEGARYRRKYGAEEGVTTDPLSIAFKRYASGEIDHRQFQEIKEEIERSRNCR